MSAIPAFAAYAVAIILVLAGVAKLATGSTPVAALAVLGFPTQVARVVAVLVPIAEMCVALFFLLTATKTAAIAQAVLCACLAGVATRLQISHSRVKCHCFGVIDGDFEQPGRLNVARAYVCLGLSLIGILPMDSTSSGTRLAVGALSASGLVLGFGLMTRAARVLESPSKEHVREAVS